MDKYSAGISLVPYIMMSLIVDSSASFPRFCLKASLMSFMQVMVPMVRDLHLVKSGTKFSIAAMSKFPRYSINNCILIASQYPEASLVCGYRKWQKEFNRVVNKGEKGIMILAPSKGKVEVEEELYDDNHKAVLDENGKQKTEIVTKEYQTFIPVYVFDVAQTQGDPLPSLATELSEQVESFEDIKRILEEISPVPNVMADLMRAQGMDEDIIENQLKEDDIDMYVISNTTKANGASVIVYSDALQQVAENLGSDLYILPSSIHEVLALPVGNKDVDSLEEMVRCVNQTEVSPTEVLSDNTYRIQQFMTITTQRRKGIGRKLLKAMVKEIRRNGGTTIIVYPCPESYSNEDMVAIEELYAIYKKMGFAFVDENADISKCNQKMYMTIS